MSREVDERVVQMYFDNQQFERGVETTMSTLDKLRKSLKLEDATSGLDLVQKTINNLDFSHMINSSAIAVEKFLQIHRHLDQVIQKVESTIKSLSIDQVTAGWGKYADKTSAVQTIMAATSKDFEDTGKQMEYVNEQLEKLNWFSDETSYSFTDMTNNVGKFTANGVKLEDAVTAMEGISTWAAISGGKTSEAARAMYNLSQALGVGAVKLIDWKSIENANMATREFKENVIETALNMGTLKREADGAIHTLEGGDHLVSATNFNEYLKDEWFNKDVLMSVLKTYGGFTDRLNQYIDEISAAGTELTASDVLGYLEKFGTKDFNMSEVMEETGLSAERLTEILTDLNSAQFDLGKRAFIAAQEAKTFGEAIEATKDAVSTGWMTTFETIFGDYEKARKLWTNVANELYDVFAESGNTRNKILKKWANMTATYGENELTGRELFLKSFRNIWDSAKSVIDTIVDARNSVLFPGLKTDGEIIKKVADSLFEFSKSFYEATSKLQFSEETLETIGNIFTSLFQTVKNIGSPIFNLIGHVVSGIGSIIRALAPYLLAAVEKVSFGLEVLSGAFSRIANSAIGKAFDWLGGVFTKVWGWIGSVAEKIANIELPDWLQDIVDWFKTIWDWLVAFGLAEDPVSELADDIEEGEQRIEKSAKSFKSMKDLVLEIIRGDYGNDPDRQALLESMGLNYRDAQDLVNKIFTPYGEFIEGWEAVLAEYENVNAYVNPPEVEETIPEEEVKKARTFVEILADLKKKIVEGFPAVLGKIGEFAANTYLKVREFGTYLNTKFGEWVEKAIAAWPVFLEKIKSGFEKVKTVLAPVTNAISAFFSKDNLVAVGTKLLEKLQKIGKALKDFWVRLKNIGKIKFEDNGFFGIIKQIFEYLSGKQKILPDSFGDILGNANLGKGLGEGLLPKLKSLGQIFGEIKDKVVKGLQEFWSKLQSIWPKVKQIGLDVFNWLKNFGASAKKVFGQAAPVIGDNFKTLAERLKSIFGGMKGLSPAEIVKKIPEIFSAIKDFFGSIGSGILEKVEGAQSAFDSIKTFIEGAITKVEEFFAWLSEQLRNLLGEDIIAEIPGVNLAKDIIAAIPNANTALEAAINAAYDEFGSGENAGGSLVDKVFEMFGGLVRESTIGKTEKAMDEFGNVTEYGIDTIGELLGSIIPLSSDASEAQDAVKDITKVFNVLSGSNGPYGSALALAFLGGAQGVANRIEGDVSTIGSSTNELMTGLTGALVSTLQNIDPNSEAGQLYETFMTSFEESIQAASEDGISASQQLEVLTTGLQTSTMVADEAASNATKGSIDLKRLLEVLRGVARVVMTYVAVWKGTKLVGGIGNFLNQSGNLIKEYRKRRYGSNVKKITNGFLTIAVSFAIIAAAIIALGRYNTEVEQGTGAATAILIGMVGVYWALKEIDKNYPKGNPAKKMLQMGIAMVAMAGSFLLFYLAISLFNKMSYELVVDGLIKIGAVLLLLVAFSKFVGNNGGKNIAVTLIAAAISIILLTGAIFLLGKMDMDTITQGLIAIGILLFELGLFSKLLGKTSGMGAAAAILAAAIAIQFLVAAVFLLGNMELETLIKGVLGVVVLLFALGKGLKMASGGLNLKSALAIVLFAGVLLVLLVVLNQLKMPLGIALVLKAIGSMFKNIAEAVKTMSGLKIGEALKGAVATALAVSAFFVIIVGVFSVIGLILDYFGAADDVVKYLGKLVPIFKKFGEFIGAAILGLIEGLLGVGSTSSLADDINKFFTGLKQIKTEDVDYGVGILKQLGGFFKEMPTELHLNLFGGLEIDIGSGGWDRLSTGLSDLAIEINKFAAVAPLVDMDAFETGLGLIEKLDETKDKLPNMNFIEEYWNWTDSFDELVGNRKNLATGLSEISSGLSGFIPFLSAFTGGGNNFITKALSSIIGAAGGGFFGSLVSNLNRMAQPVIEHWSSKWESKTMTPFERLGMAIVSFTSMVESMNLTQEKIDDFEDALGLIEKLAETKSKVEAFNKPDNILYDLFSFTDTWSSLVGSRRSLGSLITELHTATIGGRFSKIFASASGKGLKKVFTKAVGGGFIDLIFSTFGQATQPLLKAEDRYFDSVSMNSFERLGQSLVSFSDSVMAMGLDSAKIEQIGEAFKLVKDLATLKADISTPEEMDDWQDVIKYMFSFTDVWSSLMGNTMSIGSVISELNTATVGNRFGKVLSKFGSGGFLKALGGGVGNVIIDGLAQAVQPLINAETRALDAATPNSFERLGQTLANFSESVTAMNLTKEKIGQIGDAFDIIRDLSTLKSDVLSDQEIKDWKDVALNLFGFTDVWRSLVGGQNNSISSLIGTIATNVGGLALSKHLGGFNIGGLIDQATKPLIEAETRALEGVTENPFERLGRSLDNFADSVSGFDKATVEKVRNALGIVRDIAKLKADIVSQQDITDFKSAMNGLFSMNDAWSELIGNKVTLGTRFYSMIPGMGPLLQAEERAMDSVTESSFERFGRALRAFSNAVSGADGQGSVNSQAITNAISASRELAKFKAEDLPDKDFISEIISGTNSWDEFSLGLKNFGDALWEFYMFAKDIDPWKLGGFSLLAPQLTELYDAMGEYQYWSNGKNISADLDSFRQALEEMALSFGSDDFDLTALTDATTAVENFQKNIVALLGTTLEDESSGQFKSFVSALETFGYQGLKHFAEYFNTIATLGEDNPYNWAVYNLCKNLSDILTLDENNDVTSVLKTALEDFAKASVKTYQDWLEDGEGSMATGYYTGAVTNFANGISKYLDPYSSDTRVTTIIDKMKDVATAAVTAFGMEFNSQKSIGIYHADIDRFSGFVKVMLNNSGFNAMLGLAAGIYHGRPVVLSAGRSIAIDLLSTINGVLRVASPSKALTETGEFADDGLVTGLMNKIGSVRAASSDVAYSVVDSMGTILEQAVTLLDDETYPTITPVLDMSYVTAGAGQINSMFGSQYMVAGVSYDKASALTSASALGKDNLKVQKQNSLYNDVVSAIAEVRQEVSALSETINGMHVVMDSGALVGSIAAPMDKALGRRAVHSARRN